MKIIKGDRVVVLAGKDKGAEGVVQRAIPETGKVIVEGYNAARRHTKARSAEEPGRIIDKDMPLDVSNVAVYFFSASIDICGGAAYCLPICSV